MASRDPHDSAQQVIDKSAAIRELALTPEQRERREVVARRTAVIQAGVKAPPSGIFGKPGKAKE